MTTTTAKTAANYAQMLVVAAAVGGCGEPAVDAVVVWVDGVADDDGNRRVRIYDSGQRDTLPLRPDIPGSSIDLLQVGLDARSRGVALSGTDATVWVDRGSGRRVTLSAAAVGREESVAPGFSFTRSGDAILRRLEVDSTQPATWLFATLAGVGPAEARTISPPADADRWTLRHAADAPVLVWAQVEGSPAAVDGRVEVWAYPSDEGEGPVVEELRPLGRGTMRGRGVQLEAVAHLPAPDCPDRLCTSPSGRQLFTMVDADGCDVWRWSWVEAESTMAETAPERIAVTCPGPQQAELLAVIGDDLLVLDDVHRLYLVDLGANQVQAIPKPAGLISARLAARGRVLLVSSPRGELVRIDAMGPRLVSGIQSGCTIQDGLAISPGGTWLVQSCNGQTASGIGFDGQIQRISVLGAELYTGIPMRPIAIDEEGNALLYSVSSDDDEGTPRGLFVLSGDGQLTRIDALEPFPGRVMLPTGGGQAVPGRFSAAGPT
ncbi:MAG: hypothetical protein K0V04_25855 [Deltaproteobacteria bacterium]|nr:hypothetical protein [Deltaproteobacteria bacterium]